jgi:hypothetical protein
MGLRLITRSSGRPVAAVDLTSDQLRGSAQAGVTIVEYGDGVRYDGDYAPAPLPDAVISVLALGTARPQAG